MPQLAGARIIVKEDPNRRKSSEGTRPQQLSVPQLGSRTYPTSKFYVEPDRIRTIRKDATVRLVRQAIVAPIIHTPWTFKEKNAPAGARDFIEEMFFSKRDWLLQGSLYGALDFGWMPYELIYEPTEDGKITISKFKQLLQDFTTILIYVDNGDFAGFTNWPMYTNPSSYLSPDGRTVTGWEVELDERYAMNINLEVEGTDWYGISTSSSLDSLVSDWNDTNESANRYDRKVAGATWVIYYPVGVTEYNDAQKSNDDIARIILATLEASGGVAIPDEIQEWVSDLNDSIDKDVKGKWRIELISADSNSASHFTDRQKYIDNLKVRVFGIPERSLLEGKFGTKAEAETHAEIGLSTVDTKHRLIVQQYNVQAINRVLRLNWGESAVNSVWIEVAPLVSSRYNHLKELYRMILQSPDVGALEAQNLNMRVLREELAIPAAEGADDVLEYEEPDPITSFTIPPEDETEGGGDENGDKKDKEEDEEGKEE